MYKSSLQQLCQANKWKLPQYSTSRQGQDHCPVFGATLHIHHFFFSLPTCCGSVKEAHNLVAKIPLDHLTDSVSHQIRNFGTAPAHEVNEAESSAATKAASDGIEEEVPGSFKNHLKELTQRTYSCLPIYSTIRLGSKHNSVFVSTVKVHEASFIGQQPKRKKLAENAAAKVAYNSLRGRTRYSVASSSHNVLAASDHTTPMAYQQQRSGYPFGLDYGALNNASNIEHMREREHEISFLHQSLGSYYGTRNNVRNIEMRDREYERSFMQQSR